MSLKSKNKGFIISQGKPKNIKEYEDAIVKNKL